MKYICYFDYQNSTISRNHVLASSNKIEYIADTLNELGEPVELISVSNVTEKQNKFYPGEVKKKNPLQTLILFPSWGATNRFLSKTRSIWHVFILFFYLLKHTHKDEKILVYHSMGYKKAIVIARKIKRFKLILEVEELYQDFSEFSPRGVRMENCLVKSCDGYLFSSDLLEQKINIQKKPFVVIYGSYKVEREYNVSFNDNDIHIVYAGNVNPERGAMVVAKTSEYLPNNYHIHIVGFGNSKDIESIEKYVKSRANPETAKVTYEGVKMGEDYVRFLQKCNIGMCTYDPHARFVETAFPSKILSYMGNGLAVLSINLKSIRVSKIGSLLSYYNNQEPEEIARLIREVSFQNDNRKVVKELSKEFKENILELLNSI